MGWERVLIRHRFKKLKCDKRIVEIMVDLDCIPSRDVLRNCLIIFTVATLLRSGSLLGGFIFDDTEAIINNKDVYAERPWTNLLFNDFWGTPLSNPLSHKSYRPLVILSYRLDVLFSGFNALVFHAENVLLHGVACTLFYIVLRSALPYNISLDRISFTAGLLFSVHPVHTEAVSALVGRADLLCAIFFNLSCLCYFYCARNNSSSLYTQSLFLILSIAFCCLSVLCKEQGIMALIFCSLHDILCTSQSILHRLLVLLKSFQFSSLCTELGKIQVKCLLWRQIFLYLGAVFLLLGRFWLMGSSLPEFKDVDNPGSFEPFLSSRFLSYNYVYAINLWMLFAPDWLCFDWSMGCIPPVRSPSDSRLIVVLILWVFISLWIRKILQWVKVTDGKILTISFLFLCVPFLPASNIFFRVGFVIAERVLYLSVGGICLLVAYSFQHLSSKVYPFAVTVTVLLYSSKSVVRTLEWKEEISLFSSGLKVCPKNAKVHYNIAKVAAEAGNVTLAIEEYQEAIRLNPRYDQAMNNLANLLRDQNSLDDAELLLEKAISIRPSFTAAWMNLGIVRASLKKYHDAEKAYLKALMLRKRYPDCYYNLGNLYLETKQLDKAYAAYLNATSLRPTHALAWSNLIAMLDNEGNVSKAMMLSKKALKYIPGEPSLHFTMANALGKTGRYQESEDHFLEAIRLMPDNPVYYANLGVLYHRWKKYEKALLYYRLALQLDPEFRSAKENVRMVEKVIMQERNTASPIGAE
ncbi:hypothetical protein QYM36_017305 [Artemia franciscana]|uniref:dolichyl-phosphate-mannose--protein mannosyltransferase n=2 Tax=Artemia franciscana TaxID=6661 RepID=A0AA88L2C1_ARTSF|nr:hypothetical protein QYM36_017305 [Artemia franciscana]